MSQYEEEDDFDMPTEEDIMQIQEDYRRQKLKENLIGPIISTAVHVTLLVLCAVFFVGEVIKKNESVEITPVQEEIPKEEPPPPPPPPEIPPPEPQEIISHDPQVTSDAVPDAADLVGAIDDVSDEPPSTDDNSEADLVNDIKPSASSITSAKMFGGRSSAGRAGALKSYGGQVAAQQALHKALAWLAKVQNPDGSWGEDKAAYDGLTGLALLVFLAHGETPKSKTFGKTVSDAIQFLANSPIKNASSIRFNTEEILAKKTSKTFLLSGPKMAAGGGANFPLHGYPHAIKTYALAEAYTMTGNYNLEEPLQDLAGVIIKGQMADGGYVYAYKTAQEPSDISFAGWNYQAMKALASTGLEFEGLADAKYKAIDHLKKISTDNFPYRNKGSVNNKNLGLMGVGTLCLQLFGEAHNFKETDRILDKLKQEAPPQMDWANAPKNSMYAWYYITFAMFQKGGSHWKLWNNKFQNVLKANQNPEGYWLYPGNFHGPGHGNESVTHKVHSTVFACLMLTVYYRYLPSTSKKGGAPKEAKVKSPKELQEVKEKQAGEELIDIF